MSAYFTTHHFAPKRHSSEQKDQPAPSTTAAPATATAETDHPHGHHVGVDTLARFLHAFSLHYGDHPGSGHHAEVHPHFDMVEGKTAYTVYGELPGLERQEVSVEVDDHLCTLTVSGLLQRSVPPEAAGVGVDNVAVAHKDAGTAAPEKKEATDGDGAGKETENGGPSSKPSEDGKGTQATEEVIKKEEKKEPQTKEENKESEAEPKWHVTERKVGQFHRTFHFPAGVVEMAGVRASMENGLLSVLVPKLKGKEGIVRKARKVEVSSAELMAQAPLV